MSVRKAIPKNLFGISPYPSWRKIFRHSASISLGIQKVFLWLLSLIDEKFARQSGHFEIPSRF